MTVLRTITSRLVILVLSAGPISSAGYAKDLPLPSNSVRISTLDEQQTRAMCRPISARLHHVRPEDTKIILCHQMAIASQPNVHDCNRVVEECMTSQTPSPEEGTVLSCDTLAQVSDRCEASANDLEQCFSELADNLVNLSKTISCETPLEVIAGLMKPPSCARIETTCG